MHFLKNERNHSSCLKIKSLTPLPLLALLCDLSCVKFPKAARAKAGKKKIGFVIPVNHFQIIQLGQHCSLDMTGTQRKVRSLNRSSKSTAFTSGSGVWHAAEAHSQRQGSARLSVQRHPMGSLASVAGATSPPSRG